MASATVRVTGLRETARAFNRLDKSLAKETRETLKKVAEPVVAATISKLSRYRQVSLNVRPRARGGSVFVRQEARKVTGKRGDFGALQMRKAFIPALEENADEIVRGLEQALDHLTREEGF